MSDKKGATTPDLTAPTVDEHAAYNQFVIDTIDPYLRRRHEALPEVLWHYTTGDTLIKILNSGAIWSTQVSCLNDQTELEYARSLLRDAMERNRAKGGAAEKSELLFETMANGLREEAASVSEWFVLSFSENQDDLSQWRAYCGGENGYAIGFDSKRLHSFGRIDASYLVPVLYERAEQERLADTVADAVVRFFLEGLDARPQVEPQVWMDIFLAAFGEILTYVAPLLKHPAFEKENEWRIVRRLRPDDFANMQYQQRQASMTRHLPLRFISSDTPKSKHLPLVSVMVGPCRNRRISQISVTDLLRTNEYLSSVKVAVSNVPFQSP